MGNKISSSAPDIPFETPQFYKTTYTNSTISYEVKLNQNLGYPFPQTANESSHYVHVYTYLSNSYSGSGSTTGYGSIFQIVYDTIPTTLNSNSYSMMRYENLNTNPTSWTSWVINTGTQGIQGIAASGLIYVIGTNSSLMYSYDSINWNPAIFTNSSYYLSSCNSVSYGNGYFCAAGVGNSSYSIFYSTDGIRWTNASYAGFNFSSTQTANYITYANGYWIAGGFGSGGSYSHVYTTNPSSLWFNISQQLFNNSGGYSGFSAAYGNGNYVLGGNAQNTCAMVYGSSLSGSWACIPQTMYNASSSVATLNYIPFTVIYQNGLFVAGGLAQSLGTANIITSLDGINWSNSSAIFGALTGNCRSIAYGNGIWVAVGTNTAVSTPISFNSNWTPNYSNLVAYYKLDDISGSTMVIDSIGGYNGTTAGTLSFGSIGRVNTCCNFTSGYISLPTTSFNNINSGTVTCWVYLPSLTNSQTIVSKQHYGTNTYSTLSIGWYLNGSGQYISGTLGKVYWMSSNGNSTTGTNTILSINTWYYIAVTFTPSSCYIYINGVLDSSYNGNFSIPNDPTPTNLSSSPCCCLIGDWFFGGSTHYYFTGYIDELALWNTPLSASAIQFIYNSQLLTTSIVTSPHPPTSTSWAPVSSNLFNNGTGYSVIFNNGLFYTTGTGGKIYSSSNGTSWTLISSIPSITQINSFLIANTGTLNSNTLNLTGNATIGGNICSGNSCPNPNAIPVSLALTQVTDVTVNFAISQNGVISGSAIPLGNATSVLTNLISNSSSNWAPYPSTVNSSTGMFAVLQYKFTQPVTISYLIFQQYGDTVHDATSVSAFMITVGSCTLTTILANTSLAIGTSNVQMFPLISSTVINANSSVLVFVYKTSPWQIIPQKIYFQSGTPSSTNIGNISGNNLNIQSKGSINIGTTNITQSMIQTTSSYTIMTVATDGNVYVIYPTGSYVMVPNSATVISAVYMPDKTMIGLGGSPSTRLTAPSNNIYIKYSINNLWAFINTGWTLMCVSLYVDGSLICLDNTGRFWTISNNGSIYNSLISQTGLVNVDNSKAFISLFALNNGQIVGIDSNYSFWLRNDNTTASSWSTSPLPNPNNYSFISGCQLPNGSFLFIGIGNQLFTKMTLYGPDTVTQLGTGSFIKVFISIGALGTYNDQLNVNGNITSSGSIAASGNITSSGSIAASGNITSSGNITASGGISMNPQQSLNILNPAADFLRINQNGNARAGVALYNGLSVNDNNGSGGLAVGTWNPPGQGNISATGNVNVGGGVVLNNSRLTIRGASDGNHYIQYNGDGSGIDGPIIHGCGGGALGSTCSGVNPSNNLVWDQSGNVTVANNLNVTNGATNKLGQVYIGNGSWPNSLSGLNYPVDNDSVNYPSAIVNANLPGSDQALMIVGNKSSGAGIRKIKMWDQLDINGNLFTSGTANIGSSSGGGSGVGTINSVNLNASNAVYTGNLCNVNNTNCTSVNSINSTVNGFSQSLGTNGWQKFPGGLMMQWGQNPASAQGFCVTFSPPFPNRVFSVVATPTSNMGGSWYCNVISFTNTSFCFDTNCGNSGKASFNWIAIGN